MPATTPITVEWLTIQEGVVWHCAALLAWVPISSRLASARFKGTTMNLTVITVHASTLDADEETKF